MPVIRHEEIVEKFIQSKAIDFAHRASSSPNKDLPLLRPVEATMA